MEATYDPYWLLSAMVQAGAALVAIIGGMVAARYVSMQADAVGMENAIADREALIERAERELVDARVEALRRSLRSSVVEGNWLQALPPRDPDLGARFEAMFWRHDLEEWEKALVSAEVKEVLYRVDRANEIALAHFFFLENDAADRSLALPDAPSWSSVRRRFSVAEAFDELLCASCYVHQAASYWHKDNPDHPALAALDRELEQVKDKAADDAMRRGRQSSAIVDRSSERLESLLEGLATARSRLGRLPTASDLSRAVVMLAVASLLMVVPSLVVMALGPTSVLLEWRLVLAGGFLVGLVLVLAFLGRLRPSVDGTAKRSPGTLTTEMRD